MKPIYRSIFPLVAALALAGCSGENDSAHANAGGNGKPGGKGQPPVPVAVQMVEQGAISSYYTATATLAAEKSAEVLARVTGVVTRLGCEEGDFVTAGHSMLTIDNAEYVYRLEQAQATRLDIESKMRRLESMRNQDLVSAEEFETTRANLKSAQAEEGLAQVTLSYTKVNAPFSGRVVTRLVDIGQNVSAGTPLFVLSDFSPLLARIHVPAKEFNKLQQHQPVELVLESTGVRLSGLIKLISPTIDPSSGTIKVTVEITRYPEGTRPGDFAQVSIVTERRTNRLLVPKIAVVTDRGEQVVYVSADSTAERRVVEIGFEDDENAEIINGIMIGESVVVKGQRSLKHGSPIKILEDTVAVETSKPQDGS